MKHPPRNIVIDWLNSIWLTDLPPNAKLISCNLRRYMTCGKEMAYPGVKRIAGECGVTDRTVQKMLKLLTEEGWLINNGQSHLLTTIYVCSIPPEIDSPPKLMTQTPEMVSGKKVINKVSTLYRSLSVSELPDELIIPIKEFIDHRVKMKKPLTQEALSRFVTAATKTADELGLSINAVIHEAIDAGWQSVKTEWIKNRLGVSNGQNRPRSNTGQNQRKLTPAERVKARHAEIYGGDSAGETSDPHVVVSVQ